MSPERLDRDAVEFEKIRCVASTSLAFSRCMVIRTYDGRMGFRWCDMWFAYHLDDMSKKRFAIAGTVGHLDFLGGTYYYR